MTNKSDGLRVAIISPTFPPFGGGGVTTSHYHLKRVLQRRGLIVKVFTFGDKSANLHDTEEVIRRGTPDFMVKMIGLVLRIFFKLQDTSKGAYQLSDIVKSGFGSSRINSPLVKFRPDVVVLPDHGCPGLLIKKISGCRTVLISHHNPARFVNNPLLGLNSELDAKLAVKLENLAMKKVDKVICPSAYMKTVFEKTYTFGGPVSVVPNVVDDRIISSVPVTDIYREIGLPAEAPLIYIPSAGSIYKGSKFVFEIINRLALSYTGQIGFFLSGSVGSDLQDQLHAVPENVRLFIPGHLSYFDNMSAVKACSFGISPTLIESFGMAILEANFCGLPMVTFDVGGNADIVINGENGFMVPCPDIENLIISAQKLLDDDFRNKMHNKTLKTVQDRFNSDVIANRFIEEVVS